METNAAHEAAKLAAAEMSKKADELTVDMVVEGANVKDPIAEGEARAKELDDVLADLNKMSEEEVKKAA